MTKETQIEDNFHIIFWLLFLIVIGLVILGIVGCALKPDLGLIRTFPHVRTPGELCVLLFISLLAYGLIFCYEITRNQILGLKCCKRNLGKCD
jgi:hypothetical protein